MGLAWRMSTLPPDGRMGAHCLKSPEKIIAWRLCGFRSSSSRSSTYVQTSSGEEGVERKRGKEREGGKILIEAERRGPAKKRRNNGYLEMEGQNSC